MYTTKLHFSEPVDASAHVPGPDSEELETLQTVLEVLSIYWKPLQVLVSVFDHVQ